MTETPEAAAAETNLAAVDLGSNSFRMVIAQEVDGGLRLIDEMREGVRLAASLDASRNLTPEGQERALACLARFGQRIRDLPRSNVRAVGTNTLRKARNTTAFLAAAEETLGHRLEVVSGYEEARLIHLGVFHSVPRSPGRRLVVDIGGGSTEIMVGEGHEPERSESLFMGCVGLSLEHFPSGKLTKKRMRRAELAAQLELQPVAKDLRKMGWTNCVGSSGTVRAIESLLQGHGWSDEGITLAGMKQLRKALLGFSNVDQVTLDGLAEERARVLAGGLAILMAVFRALRIERMLGSPGALREGVLYDLVGRIHHQDVRDRTIGRLEAQYRVDTEQAARVEATVLGFLDAVTEPWSLEVSAYRPFLSWAARLHEIGLAVSHSGYHKHGAYLLAASDLPGFSRQDQALLALLVRSQRRKLKRSFFTELEAPVQVPAMRLSVLFRLAVLLNRSRSSRALPGIDLEPRELGLGVRLNEKWLRAHPLTREDLRQEASYLQSAGIELELPGSRPAS